MPGASSTRSQEARSRPASPAYARRGTTASARRRWMRQLDHRSSAPRGSPAAASATRYGAKRVISRRGSRATTSTPSGVSSRSSIGAPSVVQLGEAAALAVRQQQPHRLEALGEAVGDAGAELVEPLARECRDLERVGVAVRELPAIGSARVSILLRTSSIGRSSAPISCSTAFTAAICSTSRSLGRRAVDDVEHEVGDERLLERRGEALDELMRQPPDEADGVGDEVAAAVVLEAARRRVERLEEPVADRDVGVGERVQQRRLARVRVAGERDGGRLGAAALLAADRRAGARARRGGP